MSDGMTSGSGRPAGAPLSGRALGRLSIGLAAIVGSLSLLGLLAIWLQFNLHDPSKVEAFLVKQINLDAEVNLATWVAVLLLFSSAALLALIASTASLRGEGQRAWWLLSAIFLAMSLDEFVSLHERVGRLVHHAVGLPGLPSFGWLLPAAVLLLVFLWGFARFLRDLPAPARRRFVGAGTVYVLGAFGVESVSAFYLGDGSTWDPVYMLITWAEESLELIGLALFVHALVWYLDLFAVLERGHSRT